MKKYIAMSLMMACLIGAIPLGASQLTDKKNELNQTQQEMDALEEEIKETQQEISQAESEIAKLDEEIIAAEEKALKVENDLVAKQGEVAEAEVALGKAIEKKDYQYEATKDRMVQMYKNGKTGYMELVFSASSLSELLSRTQYVKVISDYDNQLLDEYKAQQKVIEEQTAILEEEEAVLQTLHEEQVAITDSLAAKIEQKHQYIRGLDNEADALAANLKAKEQTSAALQAEIKKLTQTSTLTYNGGEFAWPVPGYYRVSSDYYNRINPVTGKAEFHKGIDIPAAYGSKVVAAADGKVIAAGPRGTFGNTVIIDHGSGLTTLYAHHSSVTVSVGQMVKKGDQIAKIGSTGRSTGNHTHFEVSKSGSHTSPWNYISR